MHYKDFDFRGVFSKGVNIIDLLFGFVLFYYDLRVLLKKGVDGV